MQGLPRLSVGEEFRRWGTMAVVSLNTYGRCVVCIKLQNNPVRLIL